MTDYPTTMGGLCATDVSGEDFKSQVGDFPEHSPPPLHRFQASSPGGTVPAAPLHTHTLNRGIWGKIKGPRLFNTERLMSKRQCKSLGPQPSSLSSLTQNSEFPHRRPSKLYELMGSTSQPLDPSPLVTGRGIPSCFSAANIQIKPASVLWQVVVHMNCENIKWVWVGVALRCFYLGDTVGANKNG